MPVHQHSLVSTETDLSLLNSEAAAPHARTPPQCTWPHRPQITLCPPDDCAATQCRDHRADRKQPSECGIDTVNATVGSSFRMHLVVFDSKGANATAERLVTVVKPCELLESYCRITVRGRGCLHHWLCRRSRHTVIQGRRWHPHHSSATVNCSLTKPRFAHTLQPPSIMARSATACRSTCAAT